ncbi:hypothetical protein Pla175_12220 [Pirellulimonas nuda]|uniref:PEP-CTERM protein-sorting domain-containing protein n=1 Tax=Pirellulimonas nuda TaxID=2528009 RepID=A0A518D8Q4_9BACT|nr:hypothetical protein [Pirellulimonas nuda]QDU87855.1 hypothetical protein Pla175_12220 [Pirellulimonas nuda]
MINPRITRPLGLLFAAAMAATAAAQTTGFSLAIAEKEQVLQYPNNPAVKNLAAWDAPSHRVFDRSAPFIELKNTSDCDCPITQFSISIGDTRYHFEDTTFGAYAVPGMTMDSSPITFDVTAVGSEPDMLTIQFAGAGLAPNELVRLRFEIAPDANQPNLFSSPDYRTVLFDGIVGAQDLMVPQTIIDLDNPSDNSQVIVSFNGTPSPLASYFQDTIVTGTQGQYFNQFLRPYSVMEGIDMFTVTGEGGVVPEPASLLLVAVTLLGPIGLLRRRNG